MDDVPIFFVSRKTKIVIIFTLILAACTIVPAAAMLNPASVYCSAMGYNLTVHRIAQGDEGLCILPNGESVNEWAFLQGYAGQNYSYCARQGYQSKRITDSKKCNSIVADICTVCILKDGSEIQVTDLMNLSFAESRCGDGSCAIGENYTTCPKDCPSGSRDGYCDGVVDGKCDPNCSWRSDFDCLVINPFFIIGLIVIAGLIGYGWYYMKKKKQTMNNK